VNKKKQKNFIRWRPPQAIRWRGHHTVPKGKVFLLLFLQKKKNPSFPVGAATPPR
jgi:hypothetical protein